MSTVDFFSRFSSIFSSTPPNRSTRAESVHSLRAGAVETAPSIKIGRLYETYFPKNSLAGISGVTRSTRGRIGVQAMCCGFVSQTVHGAPDADNANELARAWASIARSAPQEAMMARELVRAREHEYRDYRNKSDIMVPV